jgi:hypothetical protein
VKRRPRPRAKASIGGVGGAESAAPVASAAAETSREADLRELRAALANLRAAAEALEMTAPPRADRRRASLLRVVVSEAERASSTLARLEGSAPRDERRRRPRAVSLAALAARLERLGTAHGLAFAPRLETPEATVADDGEELVEALLATLAQLRHHASWSVLDFAGRAEGALLSLEFSWPTDDVASSRLRAVHAEVLGATQPGGRSLRDTVQACGGEVWITLRRNTGGDERGSLRLLLPRATKG